MPKSTFILQPVTGDELAEQIEAMKNSAEQGFTEYRHRLHGLRDLTRNVLPLAPPLTRPHRFTWNKIGPHRFIVRNQNNHVFAVCDRMDNIVRAAGYYMINPCPATGRHLYKVIGSYFIAEEFSTPAKLKQFINQARYI